MPRPRSPNRDRAYEIYKKHNGSIENRRIAEQLNEDERLIAVWKSRDGWLKKGNLEAQVASNVVQQTNDVQQKPIEKINSPHPQARLGNQNAVGNKGGSGASLGEKRALKHGAYETILLEDLTDEQRAKVAAVTTDIESSHMAALQVAVARELLMQERLAKVKAHPMNLKHVTTEKGDTTITYSGKGKGGKTKETRNNTTTEMKPTIDRELEIEAGRSVNLRLWLKASEQLHKLDIDKRKMQIAEDNTGREAEGAVFISGEGDLVD